MDVPLFVELLFELQFVASTPNKFLSILFICSAKVSLSNNFDIKFFIFVLVSYANFGVKPLNLDNFRPGFKSFDGILF